MWLPDWQQRKSTLPFLRRARERIPVSVAYFMYTAGTYITEMSAVHDLWERADNGCLSEFIRQIYLPKRDVIRLTDFLLQSDPFTRMTFYSSLSLAFAVSHYLPD